MLGKVPVSRRCNDYSVLSDADLILLLKKEDHKAYKTLFDRYYRELYFFSVKYLKSKAQAQDSVQDIFYFLWDGRDTLDEAKSLRAFLYTILRNRILNGIRKNKKEILTAFPDDDSACGYSMDEADSSQNEQKLTKSINYIIRSLSKRQQDIFVRKVFDDRNNKQVANELSISENTVKVHYQRSLKKIKATLKQLLADTAE